MKTSVDPKTIEKIHEILEQRKSPNKHIRIYMKGMKCGGPIFGIVIDEAKEGDLTDVQDGITFVIEPDLYDQNGDFAIEFASGGFAVVPVTVVDEQGCVSCGNCPM